MEASEHLGGHFKGMTSQLVSAIVAEETPH